MTRDEWIKVHISSTVEWNKLIKEAKLLTSVAMWLTMSLLNVTYRHWAVSWRLGPIEVYARFSSAKWGATSNNNENWLEYKSAHRQRCFDVNRSTWRWHIQQLWAFDEGGVGGRGRTHQLEEDPMPSGALTVLITCLYVVCNAVQTVAVSQRYRCSSLIEQTWEWNGQSARSQCAGYKNVQHFCISMGRRFV